MTPDPRLWILFAMILVTGSLAFDYIMDFPGKFSEHIMPEKIHILNLSFLVKSLKKEKGGTAGNIAYNLGLLKTPVGIMASAGEDFAGYSDFLASNNVDISAIKIVKNEHTASAFITTDLSDNQITGFYPGAMSYAKNLSLKKLKTKPSLVVIAPNDPEAMLSLCLECKKLKIPYMIDPGMQLPRLSSKDLTQMVSGAKFLIANDYEMQLLMEKISVSLSKIHDFAEIVITTLGEKGSFIQTRNEKIEIKSVSPKKVADPTGAGDAYRSGFLAGFVKNLDLKVCGQMGAINACYAIEKYGTTSHTFKVSEFSKRYQENFKEKLLLPS